MHQRKLMNLLLIQLKLEFKLKDIKKIQNDLTITKTLLEGLKFSREFNYSLEAQVNAIIQHVGYVEKDINLFKD